MTIYRSTRNSIYAENELTGFNLRANSAKTLLTNVLDIEEDFGRLAPTISTDQSQNDATKSLLKSALDMEEDFQIPPNSNDLLAEPTKSILKGALDMEEDLQTLVRSPNATSQPALPNLDLDYDFRMCNIVNLETARIRRSLPKTASLLRFFKHLIIKNY